MTRHDAEAIKRQTYRCHVLAAGPSARRDEGRVAVKLVSVDPLMAIGWRDAERMSAEVLATALTAISAGLQVSCTFAGDQATGDIVEFSLIGR